ncbi:MAG: PAS domain S-box protein [Verrucomicrobiales bacterium]
MKDSVHLLLVEDDDNDAWAIERELERSHTANYALTRVATLEAALKVIQQRHFTLVLLDLGLPDSKGIDTFYRFHGAASHLPTLVLSGYEDENVATLAVQIGAKDYFVKNAKTRPLGYAIEHRRMEEKIATIARLQYAVSALSAHALHGTPFRKLISEAVASVAEVLNVESSHIFELKNEQGSAMVIAGFGWASEFVGRHAKIDPTITRKLRSNVSVVLEESPKRSLGETDDTLFAARNVRGCVYVPIHGADQPWGLLGAHTDRYRVFSQQELHFLQTIGHYLSEALQRESSELELLRSQSQFSSIFHASPAAISINTLAEGRFIEVNDEYCTLIGYTREELMASSVIGLNIWEKTADRAPIMQKLRERGSIRDLQTRYRRKSGEIRDVSMSLELTQLLGEPEPVLIALIKDITDLKRAEAAVRESEERFRILSKATNDAVWDWNVKNNVLWWNEGLQELFGLGPGEIKELKSWADRIHPEDRRGVLAKARRANKSGQNNWTGEYRFQRKDGTYAWVRDRGYFLYDSEGKLARVIGGMTDITQRREVEDRMAEQAALLDIAHDAILVKDLDGKIMFWNKGAERTYGWTTAEAVGCYSQSLLHKDTANFNVAREILLKNGEWKGEMQKLSKGGAKLSVEVRWTLVRDSLGAPKAILAINSDVTEKKRFERQFYRAQRMESIGTLAGGIAHDLNNVLAPIMMAAELLMDTANAEEKAFLETIQNSAKRGAELIKQVLSFARGAEGQRVTVDVSGIVQEVERIVKETFPKSISSSVHLATKMSFVTADPTQLHQVLMNLCVNARDAMATGGRLSMTVEKVALDQVYVGMNPEARIGNYVVVTVADTGTGIPRHLREKIFEPFFTTKELGKGTGLGLSTSLGIVRDHGGFITVYSESDQGTRFKVYIPCAAAELQNENSPAKESYLPRGNGELVLLIEDEENIRMVTKKTLESYNYQVALARNGAEGVAVFAAQREKIAVVLTDMAMPVMDGPAAIVAIRALDPKVKIIGCSGHTTDARNSQVRGAGVQHVLAKPFTAESLLTTVELVLRGSRSYPALGAIPFKQADLQQQRGAPENSSPSQCEAPL